VFIYVLIMNSCTLVYLYYMCTFGYIHRLQHNSHFTTRYKLKFEYLKLLSHEATSSTSCSAAAHAASSERCTRRGKTGNPSHATRSLHMKLHELLPCVKYLISKTTSYFWVASFFSPWLPTLCSILKVVFNLFQYQISIISIISIW